MKKSLLVVCLLLMSLCASAAVNVTITTPSTSTATVSTTTKIIASATSDRTVTGWAIYADGKALFSTLGPTSKIDQTISLSAGAHDVIVRAWDSSGAYDSAYLKLTASADVAPEPSGPTAPADAAVYDEIDQMTGWGNCRSLDCSGSDAWASYSMTQGITDPSLDGLSTKFYMKGNAWADVLWWRKLGSAQSDKTHFLFDFWVKPGSDTLNNTQALEYDVVMVRDGRKWDFSHQMHYTSWGYPYYPHWDTWDGQNLKWVHTSVACPKLDPSKWHHVQILGERVGNQTHNISFTVDDKTYPVPDKFTWKWTRSSGWANSVNVQVQMDLNQNGGTSTEYIDKMKLYVW